jgi:hypothetical protein
MFILFSLLLSELFFTVALHWYIFLTERNSVETPLLATYVLPCAAPVLVFFSSHLPLSTNITLGFRYVLPFLTNPKIRNAFWALLRFHSQGANG